MPDAKQHVHASELHAHRRIIVYYLCCWRWRECRICYRAERERTVFAGCCRRQRRRRRCTSLYVVGPALSLRRSWLRWRWRPAASVAYDRQVPVVYTSSTYSHSHCLASLLALTAHRPGTLCVWIQQIAAFTTARRSFTETHFDHCGCASGAWRSLCIGLARTAVESPTM